jgi:hypothetical protein
METQLLTDNKPGLRAHGNPRHIAPGRAGLFKLIKSLPASLRYEPGLIMAEGDYVMITDTSGVDTVR